MLHWAPASNQGFGGNKGHQCWSGGLLPFARGQIVWPYLVAASASNLDTKYSLEYKSFDFERRGRASKLSGQREDTEISIQSFLYAPSVISILHQLVGGLYDQFQQ